MAIGDQPGLGQDFDDQDTQSILAEDTVTTDDTSWGSSDTDQGLEEAAGIQATGDQFYTIDGRRYSATDIRQYIKGGMLERDYRSKTSALARERQELERHRQSAEAWQTLQQYPELMKTLGEKINELIQGGASPAQAEAIALSEADMSETPWKKEVKDLQVKYDRTLQEHNKRFEEYNKYMWENYRARRSEYATAQLGKLEEKYPYLYSEEVINAFRDDEKSNLEALAKESHEHWKKFSEEKQRRLTRKPAPPAVPVQRIETARKGGAPTTLTKRPKTYEDARASAFERLTRAGDV
jgi:hypothetical protein